MTDREYIFLPHDQIVDAICTDFRQYEPQILLFCEIIRLISNGETIVKRTPDLPGGIWIRKVGSRNMRRLEDSDLVDYMCTLLEAADISPQKLCEVASRVFQAKVIPSQDPDTGRSGFLIETSIEDFRCRQCGHCCQSLDYHYEITEDDVARWKALGRTDILKWVGVFKGQNQETVYQIWVTPGTRQVADTCPFLEKDRATKRWFCRIHDAKPSICRQYPVGRKHANLTGCPGFDDK